MQYPPGTSFQVSKNRLARSGLANKHILKDGIYTILNISKTDGVLHYRFNASNTSSIVLTGTSCSEFDKYVAFCRNEPFKETIINNTEDSVD